MDLSHQISDHKQENCVVDQVESKPEGNKIKSLCVLWQLCLWTWTEPDKSQNTALLLVQLLANNTRASVTGEKNSEPTSSKAAVVIADYRKTKAVLHGDFIYIYPSS